MNAFVDPANTCLELSQEQVILRNELQAIAEALLKGGFYFRLIMTDDILHMADIRQRAKDGMSPNPNAKGKDNFFYGAALAQSLQDRIDAIVRASKPLLMDAVKGGKTDLLEEYGITAAFDTTQKAYLVQFKNCGMGFYFSERIHTPRENRPKRMTLAAVAHSAGIQPEAKIQPKAQPKKAEPKAVKNTVSEGSKRSPKAAPVKRRQFTVIREIRS